VKAINATYLTKIFFTEKIQLSALSTLTPIIS
jgi:hypothetical protein